MRNILTAWIGAMLTMAATGAANVHSFEIENRVSAQVLDWRVVNDNVMGGRSLGDVSRTAEALFFSGSLNTNGGGFASIRVPAQNVLTKTTTGLRLKVRGDGRDYTFRLRPRNSRISYWSQFATEPGEWREVELPLASFWPNWRGRRLNAPEITAAEVAELGLMINDGIDGAFALEIDWIAAY